MLLFEETISRMPRQLLFVMVFPVGIPPAQPDWATFSPMPALLDTAVSEWSSSTPRRCSAWMSVSVFRRKSRHVSRLRTCSLARTYTTQRGEKQV